MLYMATETYQGIDAYKQTDEALSMLPDRLKNEQMLNLVYACLDRENNNNLTVEQICSFPILQPYLEEINSMPDIVEEIEEEQQEDSSVP